MLNEDCKDYGILEINSSTKNFCVYLTDQEYVSHYEPQRDTIIPISVEQFIFKYMTGIKSYKSSKLYFYLWSLYTIKSYMMV
jgi:hypothetical protein